MGLWKYLQLSEMIRERSERNDPQYDQSFDVKDNQYPNYAGIPNYNYKPEIIAGYHLIIGLSIMWFIDLSFANNWISFRRFVWLFGKSFHRTASHPKEISPVFWLNN